MVGLKEIKDSILHLLFPHVCCGCGNDLPKQEDTLCIRCIANLPETKFEMLRANPVEKMFWGRLPVEKATAQFYFTKDSLAQQLMHQFKYKGNRELGLLLGRMMGVQILHAGRFDVDALVPLPLFASKEKRRGFNQAMVLCEGISSQLKIPILTNVVKRSRFTETQTKKNRIERWKNIEGMFYACESSAIENKHILLIDDVITTGATLEACGEVLLKEAGVKLSIATLFIASR